jgi:hypothetical protein
MTENNLVAVQVTVRNRVYLEAVDLAAIQAGPEDINEWFWIGINRGYGVNALGYCEVTFDVLDVDLFDLIDGELRAKA